MMNAPSGAPCIDALPPDSAKTSRSTWLAVGSLSVGSFAMVSTEFMPIGLLTDIASTLNVSNGTAGLMITMPGILAAFAYPSYRRHVQRGEVAQATRALSEVRAAMEQHFLSNGSYAGGPCTESRTVASFTVVCASAPSAASYTLTATGSGPTAGFAYTLDQNGRERSTALPADWGTAPAGCWILRAGRTC